MPTPAEVLEIQEEHTKVIDLMAKRARDEMDALYVSLVERATSVNIASFFGLLADGARELIGQWGEASRVATTEYNRDLLGFEPRQDPSQEIAVSLEKFDRTIDAHTSHSLVMVELWVEGLADKGMASDEISLLVQQDFQQGGEFFGAYKNQLKRTVGNAVLQVASDVRLSAFRKVERRVNA